MVERGLQCEIITLDIRDRASVDALFDTVFGRHGKVDLLINSAGGQFPQAAIDFSEKGWRAVIDTNLTGKFNMMQRAARAWRNAALPGSICDDRRLPSRPATRSRTPRRGARGGGRIQ